MYEQYRHVVRRHVHQKCWLLDITWAEVEQLIGAGEVVEHHDLGEQGLKEIRLLLNWTRPLHLVYVVNHAQQVVAYITLYEPNIAQWHRGFRKRRRQSST